MCAIRPPNCMYCVALPFIRGFTLPFTCQRPLGNSKMYVEYLAALLGAVFNHALTGPASHTAEAQSNLFILVSGHFIRYTLQTMWRSITYQDAFRYPVRRLWVKLTLILLNRIDRNSIINQSTTLIYTHTLCSFSKLAQDKTNMSSALHQYIRTKGVIYERKIKC